MKKELDLAVMFSDVHLTAEGTENKKILNVVEQIVNFCVKKQIKLAFFLGDMFQDLPTQTLETMEIYKHIVKLFIDNGIKMFAIPGNHDKVDLNSSKSFLDLICYDIDEFSHCIGDYYKVYSMYGVVKTQHNLWIGMLPFFENNDLYNSLLEFLIIDLKNQMLSGDKAILLTHIGVNGAKNLDGTNFVSNVTSDKFKFFDDVFIGHYHNAHNVDSNVHYIGAIRQRDFEDDNVKGFTVIRQDGSTRFEKTRFCEFVHLKFDISEMTDLDISNLLLQSKNMLQNRLLYTFKYSLETESKIPVTELLEMGIDVRKELKNFIITTENNDDSVLRTYRRKSLLKNWFAYCKDNYILGDKLLSGLKHIIKR